ncbi:MAG: prepilin-type N-terminal cleavage/methylation domain-containing protein [Ruminococcus sp.]|nr:prepilin-type N-terminal cleavage/methylation domain-containing protein [Ruminococcus sp.]
MRKHQKGMTVVEVVVAFALISLSAAIGMAGIASGASLLHAGATLKKERSQI